LEVLAKLNGETAASRDGDYTIANFETTPPFYDQDADTMKLRENEGIPNRLLDTHYSTNDQITLKNLQSNVTESKLDFAK
ncbi:hypothetical protein STEG23_037835, partial [Scotinomys teguina]